MLTDGCIALLKGQRGAIRSHVLKHTAAAFQKVEEKIERAGVEEKIKVNSSYMNAIYGLHTDGSTTVLTIVPRKGGTLPAAPANLEAARKRLREKEDLALRGVYYFLINNSLIITQSFTYISNYNSYFGPDQLGKNCVTRKFSAHGPNQLGENVVQVVGIPDPLWVLWVRAGRGPVDKYL